MSATQYGGYAATQVELVRRRASGLAASVARRARAAQAVVAWTLVCAGLLPVLLTGAWLLGDALQPAFYSPVRQTVSQLAGYAGTDRWIMTGALYLIGVCYLGTAAGLRALWLPARIGLLAAGLAAFGIASCPEPVHGGTLQHAACTGIGAFVIAVWPVLVARRDPKAAVLNMRITVTTTAVFVGLFVWTVIETRTGTVLGLAERLSASIQVCWPFVVAVALRRTRPPAADCQSASLLS